MTIEICANSYQSAINAQNGGADRPILRHSLPSDFRPAYQSPLDRSSLAGRRRSPPVDQIEGLAMFSLRMVKSATLLDCDHIPRFLCGSPNLPRRSPNIRCPTPTRFPLDLAQSADASPILHFFRMWTLHQVCSMSSSMGK